jgi:hypothetical protein
MPAGKKVLARTGKDIPLLFAVKQITISSRHLSNLLMLPIIITETGRKNQRPVDNHSLKETRGLAMLRLINFRHVIRAALPAAVVLILLSSGIILAASTFSNGDFETFQSYENKFWRDYPERYGTDWSVQVISEDGLHFMDSHTFGQFAAEVYGVPYLNYKLLGDYSQAFASRHGFNFVFYQTVTVTPGTDYSYGGKIVSYWKGSGGEQDDTKIFKRIGIDWSGGTDYSNPDIEWTDWDGTDNAWISPAMAGSASGSQATLFIQVDNRGDDVGAAHLNTGHFDSFYFETAPGVDITAPAQAAPGQITITWDEDIDSSWSLCGYDVLFRDDLTNNWQTIQTVQPEICNGRDESYQFAGETGKSYTIRIRPWQQYGSGDAARPALPGTWHEQTIDVGGAIVGQVTNHMGLPVADVTVTISGTTTSATSMNNGRYILPAGAGTFAVLATNKDNLVAPPAGSVTVPGLTENGQLDITMRPAGADQAIANGDFETELTGWQVSGSAAITGSDKHSGQGSLALTGTSNVSQTNPITAVFNPLLSFWYKSDVGFEATLSGQINETSGLGSQSTPVSRQTTLPAAPDWTFATLDMSTAETITGDMAIQFETTGSGIAVFVDEVSLANGPQRQYLPAVFK